MPSGYRRKLVKDEILIFFVVEFLCPQAQGEGVASSGLGKKVGVAWMVYQSSMLLSFSDQVGVCYK